MLISNLLSGFIIAISFFTVIPMPFIDWTEAKTKYMPLFIPFVGLIIGGLSVAVYKAGLALNINGVLLAVIMTAYYLIITGGVHFDGLMDSADGYFSRRDTKRKLEIMTDSRVGAFAVMTAIAVLLVKFGCFVELIDGGGIPVLMLVVVPVISRTLQPSMLYLFPQAKNEGLAKMYGNRLGKAYGYLCLGLFAAAAIAVWRLVGLKYVIVPLVANLYYTFFYFSSKKQFGGVTGDLLGAFLEISELLMWFVMAVL